MIHQAYFLLDSFPPWFCSLIQFEYVTANDSSCQSANSLSYWRVACTSRTLAKNTIETFAQIDPIIFFASQNCHTFFLDHWYA
jgi:hypothetical protein